MTLHGPRHHLRQRTIAVVMIASGLLRVTIWATMLVLYALNVAGVRHLYAQVSFVTILSVLALLLTDWGQVAASLAQFSAGAAHEDSEHTRYVLTLDMAELDMDLRHLADLQPGVEAHQLARRIGERLKGQP